MAHSENLTPEEAHKANVRRIWTVTGILAGVTALEFLLAFTMPAGIARNMIFVIMTFIKAFYIVAEFMHLRHEVKVLIWSIVLPCAFVVWLVIALLVEGSSIFAK
ncbi:MAG: cytochrome C oxidase subunit IV family protein [Cytophagales bacterium]|nr:cytochrome C oxidase subunit IV family protein [Bernardetiaceae bacterium]MDW8204404.1 cytochrome C oxidase subunit IV family protein [Cytophagales bacterium]